MDTLHRVCAGLDVHKDTVVACVRRLDDRDRDHADQWTEAHPRRASSATHSTDKFMSTTSRTLMSTTSGSSRSSSRQAA